HGGMDHGGMDMSCSMNMIWNWDTRGLCVVSSSWRIDSTLQLYLSLVLIAMVGVLYEWLRLYIRRLDAKIARSASLGTSNPAHRRRASVLPTSSSSASPSDGLLGNQSPANRRSPSLGSTSSFKRGGLASSTLPISRRTQTLRSSLYALSVFISFWLMLVSMSFNAWLISAIVAGAGIGHFLFSRDFTSLSDDTQGLACH
ncbi:Ctr copper transporter, partial [Testicularia cyperi]